MNLKGCEKERASSKSGINSEFTGKDFMQTGMNFNQAVCIRSEI